MQSKLLPPPQEGNTCHHVRHTEETAPIGRLSRGGRGGKAREKVLIEYASAYAKITSGPKAEPRRMSLPSLASTGRLAKCLPRSVSSSVPVSS